MGLYRCGHERGLQRWSIGLLLCLALLALPGCLVWADQQDRRQTVNHHRTFDDDDPDLASLPPLFRHYSYIASPHMNLDLSRVEVVSWERPRAFLFRNFLSKNETALLRDAATPELHRSTVVNFKDSGSIVSDYRTSWDSFFSKGTLSKAALAARLPKRRATSSSSTKSNPHPHLKEYDPSELIWEIEKRLGAWTHLDRSRSEPLSILRYDVSQQYREHMDAFADPVNKQEHFGGQRELTALMYLADVDEGGETVFPKAHANDEKWSAKAIADMEAKVLKTGVRGKMKSGQGAGDLPCGETGPSVLPREGDVLLFFSLFPSPNKSLDSGSTHAGCPVIRGEKWSMTSWSRIYPAQVNYRKESSDAVIMGFHCEERDNIVCPKKGPEDKQCQQMKSIPFGCTAACGSCVKQELPAAYKSWKPSAEDIMEIEKLCVDENTMCHSWSQSGECTRNPGFMREQCRKSCGICGFQGHPVIEQTIDSVATRRLKGHAVCDDQNDLCAVWASVGECTSNREFMEKSCRMSCNICHTPGHQGHPSHPGHPALDTDSTGECIDKNLSCRGWALNGECDKNPGYMHIQCMQSCKKC